MKRGRLKACQICIAPYRGFAVRDISFANYMNVNISFVRYFRSLQFVSKENSGSFRSGEKPRMSGFHLGIRFEVSGKLAGTRGSETPNFETSRVTYRRLPSNLSTCCGKFMKKTLNNSRR